VHAENSCRHSQEDRCLPETLSLERKRCELNKTSSSCLVHDYSAKEQRGPRSGQIGNAQQGFAFEIFYTSSLIIMTYLGKSRLEQLLQDRQTT
jgi:hypothetical protein